MLGEWKCLEVGWIFNFRNTSRPKFGSLIFQNQTCDKASNLNPGRTNNLFWSLTQWPTNANWKKKKITLLKIETWNLHLSTQSQNYVVISYDQPNWTGLVEYTTEQSVIDKRLKCSISIPKQQFKGVTMICSRNSVMCCAGLMFLPSLNLGAWDACVHIALDATMTNSAKLLWWSEKNLHCIATITTVSSMISTGLLNC
jgi:hypothetical protein